MHVFSVRVHVVLTELQHNLEYIWKLCLIQSTVTQQVNVNVQVNVLGVQLIAVACGSQELARW